MSGVDAATGWHSHLRPGDLLGVSSIGLRTRKARTALTAIGIAIGIAALVAVMGISASSRAQLQAELDALGTNRLQVRPGSSFTGGEAALTEDTVAMISRVGPVDSVSGTTPVDTTVRRTDYVDSGENGGITVYATDDGLGDALGATLLDGRFLDEAAATMPTIVLGSTAATTLGIDAVTDDPMVYLDGTWFSVLGILEPLPLFPNLDRAAFIGSSIAADLYDTDTVPTNVYVVTRPDQLDAVREVLPATANPTAPGEIEVSRPSDAIAAEEAVDEAFTGLLLGLGGVALLVGGIGIANVMVISVLERRTEIGVRRALGATKGHIRMQFLTEAVLLSALGGVIGLALGVFVTGAFALVQTSVLAVPPTALAVGFGSAIVVGALAGISPAGRAARLAPADAVRPA